jgi:PAS domain S-box-containing protein
MEHDEADSLLVSDTLGDQCSVLKGADNICRVILEGMQEGYTTITSDGTILFCNKSFLNIVKIPLARVIGLSIYKLLKPKERKAFACFLSMGNESFKTKCSLKTGDSLYAPVFIFARNINNDGNMITCLIVTDLTEQKRSERFTQIMFNQTKEPVITCDKQGRIIQTNPAADLILGKQLVGNDLNVAIPLYLESDGTRFRLNQALDSKLSCGIEVTYKRCDGNKLYLLINASRFNIEKDDSSSGCVITLTDITCQRQLDMERARFDRLNLIGEMAAGIGHEVRNPLTTVRGYLQMFQRKQKFADHQEQFSTMIEELDRANSIITEFLSLAKNKPAELIPGNLNGTIHALFPLIQADAFRLGHTIQTDIGDIPAICYDDKEIRQLILNLIRNGMEAMEPGGIITIETYTEKDEIILAVKDRGTGIPEEVLNKLGTPFMTTKECGTGLGVSICYRIAKRHGAKIEIKTSSKGTKIFVKFKAHKV